MKLPRWSVGHHTNKDTDGKEYEVWYIMDESTGQNVPGSFTGDSSLIKEAVKAHNVMIDHFGTMALRSVDALRILVLAKEMSDTTGKTPEYKSLKDLGWATAKDIILAYEKK